MRPQAIPRTDAARGTKKWVQCFSGEGRTGVTDEQMAVWNRAALERGGRTPRGGDAALAALLHAHSLVMNGGVRHAVEVLESRELEGACDRFRFFGFDEVAALLERAAGGPWGERGDAAFDAEYARVIASDGAIIERFERHFFTHRQFYSPTDSPRSGPTPV